MVKEAHTKKIPRTKRRTKVSWVKVNP